MSGEPQFPSRRGVVMLVSPTRVWRCAGASAV